MAATPASAMMTLLTVFSARAASASGPEPAGSSAFS